MGIISEATPRSIIGAVGYGISVSIFTFAALQWSIIWSVYCIFKMGLMPDYIHWYFGLCPFNCVTFTFISIFKNCHKVPHLIVHSMGC